MNLLTTLWISYSYYTFCKAAKILGVFPSSGYSQFILAQKLMGELASGGHEVTVISLFKPKNEIENYKTVYVDKVVEQMTGDLFFLQKESAIVNLYFTYEFGEILTELLLNHTNVQKLIRSKEKFDLVIVEQFYNEAHMAFAAHFNAPLVMFSSIGPSDWNQYQIGNLHLPSILAVSATDHTNEMQFFQRVKNAFTLLFDIGYKKLISFPRHQKLINKYFHTTKIELNSLLYSASLMLYNSHPSISEPSAITSAGVEIGGFHVSPKKLTKKLQDFLDSSQNGAVFFSLGSNLNSSDLPEEVQKGILKAFQRLKVRVLWKFEDDKKLNENEDILISKWLPQADILAHRNIKAFITHGGLLSTIEAVYNGVPMVGIPVFGDQKMNVARSCQNGIAVKLDLQEINEENLYNALFEILNNPKYKENAERRSSILRSGPLSGMELAIHWIDLVLKYRDMSYLRNASLKLNWFQIYCLDIVAFLLFNLFIFLKFFQFLHKLLKKYPKTKPIKASQKKEA